MMHRLLFGCVGWLVLAGPYQAWAQAPTKADSAVLAAALTTANQLYARKVQPESVLFDGPEYVNYNQPGTIGHQFFLDPDPQLGTVTYRNGYFQDVRLSYDLARDQVVMTYPSQAVAVLLVPEKITSFSLGSHQFIRLLGDSTTQANMPTGFYEVLLPGPVTLLARYTKKIQQTTVLQNLRLEFKQTDRLFARTASTSAEVTNLKDLLALLPTHKAEVQRYARQQKLRFSVAQREASALSTLRYYYSLPQ